MNLKNLNPTETEKQMYQYMGLYIVEKTDDIIKYAPVHVDNDSKEFPLELTLESSQVEWDNNVIFSLMSECVTMETWFDMKGITLIQQRMVELGWK